MGTKREVQVNLDGAKTALRRFATDETLAALRRVLATEILPRISKGISPVRGERNFVKYKNKDRYPGDRKPSNKPNLYLTGEMLSWYRVERSPGRPNEFLFGIPGSAPQAVRDRAEGNNQGTRNGVPARPFIPLVQREETFQISIMSAIRRALAESIQSAIDKTRGGGRRRR